MDQFIEYLKSVGPFTTPLCVAMAGALWWLDKDRDRLLAELRTMLISVTSLQERRAEDLAHGVLDYQEHATATQAVITKFDETVRTLTNEIARLKSIFPRGAQ